MAIEQIEITSRDQWLAARSRDITASAIGCLLGVHDYLTPFELWGQKTGRMPDAEDTPAMKRGRLLEPVAVELIREKHPDWELTKPNVYLRNPETRIGCTPDLWAKTPDGKRVNVQIKTTADLIFKKKWLDPDTREITLPLWIACQSMSEVELGECDDGIVALMVVGLGLELYEIDVPQHPGVIKRMREAVADFWKLTDSGQPMPPDYARDGEAIKRIYASDGAPEIDLSGDNEFGDALGRYRAKRDEEKLAKAAKDAAAAEIEAKMGNSSVAKYYADSVTWKLQHRKGYSVAPTSFRVLRA